MSSKGKDCMYDWIEDNIADLALSYIEVPSVEDDFYNWAEDEYCNMIDAMIDSAFDAERGK